jgi:hypothetical protein
MAENKARRVIIKKFVIKHKRGEFEDYASTTESYRVVLNALPTYDYADWSLTDLKDMNEALTEFISQIESLTRHELKEPYPLPKKRKREKNE